MIAILKLIQAKLSQPILEFAFTFFGDDIPKSAKLIDGTVYFPNRGVKVSGNGLKGRWPEHRENLKNGSFLCLKRLSLAILFCVSLVIFPAQYLYFILQQVSGSIARGKLGFEMDNSLTLSDHARLETLNLGIQRANDAFVAVHKEILKNKNEVESYHRWVERQKTIEIDILKLRLAHLKKYPPEKK